MPEKADEVLARAANAQAARERRIALYDQERNRKKYNMTFLLLSFLLGLSIPIIYLILHSHCRLTGTRDLFIKFQQTKKELNETFIQLQQKLVEIARKDCDAFRKELQDNSVIGFDGSWDHPRHGSHCVVEAIDTRTNKIIDFEVVKGNNTKNKAVANYIGPSNGMERNATRKIIERLKKDKRIKGYVHDKDAKTAKDFRDMWGIAEHIDANHVGKAFRRNFKTVNNGKKKGFPKNCLSGLEESLPKYLKEIIGKDVNESEKLRLWHNAPNHYQGNHKHCIHKHLKNETTGKGKINQWAKNITKEKISYLEKFLTLTEKYLVKTTWKYSTQSNEAFHALKALLMNKKISWGRSYEARIACAVIQFNHPTDAVDVIAKGLEIEDLKDELMPVFDNFVKQRVYVKTYKKHNRKRIRLQKARYCWESMQDYLSTSEYKMSRK